MKVRDVMTAMEEIAPTRFAAAWDNVGLIVGDPERDSGAVLLTIDTTAAVLEEARRRGCGVLISYHPPVFDPQKCFLAGSVAYDAARAGLSIYSPHTALDVAAGGTNDVLADAVEMTVRKPLRTLEPRDAHYKLVTFVPAEHADAVTRAMFDAGAGRIGDYSSCSFRVAGTGTFFGESGARPAVGDAGRLERVEELRVETVVPAGAAGEVVRAMRAAHPYEEPAFDLVRLAPPPGDERGFGRVGVVPRACLGDVIARLKRFLGAPHVLVGAGGRTSDPLDRPVERVAVCAGSCGELVHDAIAAKADVLVTGELRHHDALRAAAAGMSVVCTLHGVSERAALPALARALGDRLPGLQVWRSEDDREPLMIM